MVCNTIYSGSNPLDTSKSTINLFIYSAFSFLRVIKRGKHGFIGREAGNPIGNVRSMGENRYGYYQVASKYSGSLPLYPGFDIDVHTLFTMQDDKDKGVMKIMTSQAGDRFPSAEVFITDTSGQSLFLTVWPARGSYPEVNVGGDNYRPMSFSSLNIFYDKNGVFTGVSTTKNPNKIYSPKEWNKLLGQTPVRNEEQNGFHDYSPSGTGEADDMN